MKLLSPTEVKDEKAQQQTRDIIRTQEIKDALNTINRQFAKAQADFNSMLTRNREAWVLEEQLHVTRVTERENELAVLEAKRAKALEPVEALMKVAQDKEKEGLTMILKNEQWRETLSDTAELLEEKLSDVADRENEVLNRENKASIREDANTVETNLIKRGMAELVRQQNMFESKKLEEEAIIARRKDDLRLQEYNLQAREDKITRDIEAITSARRMIEDARGVIEREYERLNIPV